jgi:hypothetical protein
MLLSEERISHLSHLIVKAMKTTPGVRLLQTEEAVVREIQQVMVAELRLDEQIDRMARERLASYSRRIPEGSPEWDVLYKKFVEEELKRRRRL